MVNYLCFSALPVSRHLLRLRRSRFARPPRPAARRSGPGIQARKYTYYFSNHQVTGPFLPAPDTAPGNADNVSTPCVANIRPHTFPFRSGPGGPLGREICTKCRTFRNAPHTGKLPLAAALSPILRRSYTGSAPLSAPRPSEGLPESFRGSAPSENAFGPFAGFHTFRTFGTRYRKTGSRNHARFPLPGRCYQLAFVTPGISPFEAISRNWIRLMPNRRI